MTFSSTGNKYQLGSNNKNSNLGGMDCGAGVISVELARDMLMVHWSTYVVVVSTQNITQYNNVIYCNYVVVLHMLFWFIMNQEYNIRNHNH